MARLKDGKSSEKSQAETKKCQQEKKTAKGKADGITATEGLILQQISPQKALGCMEEMSLHTLKGCRK